MRSGCRSLCAARQECRSPSSSRLLVGPEGRRALERGALGRLGDREGRRLTLEDHEAQLGEDPYQPSREGRGPRLGAVSGEHRLAGLPLRTACLAECAVDGSERGAQGVVPFDVFVWQSLAQARPRPGGSSPAPGRCSSAGCGGRVERDDVGERLGQAGVVAQGVPAREGEAADSALQRARAVRCVGGHDEHVVARSRRGRRSARPPLAAYVLEPRRQRHRRRAPARGSATDSVRGRRVPGSGSPPGPAVGRGDLLLKAGRSSPARRSRRSAAAQQRWAARRIRRGSVAPL